jgi:hypothetical protein
MVNLYTAINLPRLSQDERGGSAYDVVGVRRHDARLKYIYPRVRGARL